MILFVAGVAWIGLGLLVALGFGKTIRLRDQGGPR